ncbi:MAG: PQQ-dependent sugar dehydrogenase [Methanoregulaceae archaeon]|nr:PQQ-dependent sugar dehydrogenase [Methanoregulaceae archaeon]
MTRSGYRYIAIYAGILLIVLVTGCISQPQVTPVTTSTPLPEVIVTGSRPSPTPPLSPLQTVQAVPDLTNQDSSLAATFSASQSQTRLISPARVAGLVFVAGGFDAPMQLLSAPDDSGRIFLVEQAGVVRIIRPDGTVLSEPFLDVRDRMIGLSAGYDERGLLGIAFHPGYAMNGRVYAFYSAPLRAGAPAGWSCTNHLSEFRVSEANPNLADVATERVILAVDKPSANHNGGAILFGPDDGYLYIPLGDGGGADDRGTGHTPGTGNAQDLSNVYGKVLRIDVDSPTAGRSYGIPADNPFAGVEGARPEIFAYGLRNPAYAAFDSGPGHHLFVASAGQRLFEPAYIVLSGGNYGWNIREGTHCFDPGNNARPLSSPCPVTGIREEALIGPIVELGHDSGNTIVGGMVYRGTILAGWQGAYISGTWSRGSSPGGDGTLLLSVPPSGFDPVSLPPTASSLTPDQNRMWPTAEIRITSNQNGRVNAYIRGIFQGADHEAYLLTNRVSGPGGQAGTGEIWRLVPPDTPGPGGTSG